MSYIAASSHFQTHPTAIPTRTVNVSSNPHPMLSPHMFVHHVCPGELLVTVGAAGPEALHAMGRYQVSLLSPSVGVVALAEGTCEGIEGLVSVVEVLEEELGVGQH